MSLNLITYQDETLSQSAWGKRLGISPATFSCRLAAGWAMERILSTPKVDNFRDLTKESPFGRWTVKEYAGIHCRLTAWRCECVCGTQAIVIGNNLVRGISNSCGCWNLENITKVPESEHHAIIERSLNGESAKQIAPSYGVSGSTISTILRNNGISLALNNGRWKHRCDDNFFDVLDTEEKAYWLGFLCGDCCIFNKRVVRLFLARRDRGHVAKFIEAIRATNPISNCKPNDHPCSGVVVSSKPMAEALMRHGVVTPGMTARRPPSELPDNLWSHYCRGLVDADGTINQTKTTNTWSLGFLGPLAVVESFRKFAVAICGTQAVIHPNPKSPIFDFAISGNTQVEAVARALYGNATVFLDRKYEEYGRLLGRPEYRPGTMLEWNGELKTVREWAEATGLKNITIRKRLKKGWSVAKALGTPVVHANGWHARGPEFSAT